MARQARLGTLDTTSRHYIAANFLLSARITCLVTFSISLIRKIKSAQGPDSSYGGLGMLILNLILS